MELSEVSRESSRRRLLRGKRRGQFAKPAVVDGMENAQRAKIEAIARETSNNATTVSPSQQIEKISDPSISGSRLIDLDVLGEELWCKTCNLALSIKHRVAEKRMGLASIFSVRCQQCERIHSAQTQKKNGKDSTYDINSRLAFAMIDAGMGETHVNTLFSGLNTPTVNHTTLKKYERKIGPAIEQVAKKSCIESIRLEKELTIQSLNSEKNKSIAAQRDVTHCFEEHAPDSSNISANDGPTTPSFTESDIPSSVDSSDLQADASSAVGNEVPEVISRTEESRIEESSPAAIVQPHSKDEEGQSGIANRKRKIGEGFDAGPGDDNIPKKKTKLGVGFDAGWQKRSSGVAYNSKSGHATAIGLQSGKILSYAIRTKDCRKCYFGHPKSDHDCRVNHTGSAKSMEASMAVQLFTKNELFEQENVELGVLVMDDDSSSVAAVRRETDLPIERLSDFNHTHKKLTSALYKMNVSAKVREYFSKNFCIAVQKNEGNVGAVRAALKTVVPHAYGDHSSCGDWCKAKDLEGEYVHRNLPHGKCLSDGNRHRLTELFDSFAKNAERIAPWASTQGNESSNNTVASKNPKTRHYSSSESMSYRTAAAVCQKNIGCRYAMQVFEEAGIAPGINTETFRERKDEIRKRKAEHDKSIEAKRRRYELKKQRSSKDSSQSNREGITYESGVSFHDVSELIPSPNPTNASIKTHPDLKNFKPAVVDIETTGYSVHHDQILEIAACCEDSNFDVYTLPSKAISKGASEATGFRMAHGELYYKDEKIYTKSAKAAILDFIQYLKSFGCPVILIAHNGFRFDAPLILKLVASVGLLQEFTKVVAGFADSWKIFKLLLPQRKKAREGFSISALVTEYLPGVDLASLHRASNDVAVLQKLIYKIGATDEIILKNYKSIWHMFDEKETKRVSSQNKETLQSFKGHLSSHIINKMSNNGINKQILQAAFDKGGHDALRALLGQNVNGKPLVTTNKDILEKLFSLYPLNEN